MKLARFAILAGLIVGAWGLLTACRTPALDELDYDTIPAANAPTGTDGATDSDVPRGLRNSSPDMPPPASASHEPEPPARIVPHDLQPVLAMAQRALESGQPARALDILAAYSGTDHAIRHLLIGHAHAELGHIGTAATAFETAVTLDPTLTEAGISRARLALANEQWETAVAWFGRFADVDAADSQTLLGYAYAAYRRPDYRLAELLVERARLRFPTLREFADLDAAILAERGRHAEAELLVRDELAVDPARADAWKRLAAVAGEQRKDAVALAALEAAHLADPRDAVTAKRLAEAQLSAGHAHVALEMCRERIGAASAPVDADWLRLGIAAADALAETALAREWLQRLPASAQSPATRRLAARLALRQSDWPTARTALQAIIAQDEATAFEFFWAGKLARDAGDLDAAEALFSLAAQDSSDAGRSARLHLGHLLIARERFADARRVLEKYLSEFPDDATARTLRNLLPPDR